MNQYNKINSVFKRNETGKNMIIGQYSTPEIEYLKDNQWEATEKVDGTNIRATYHATGKYMDFKGKSDDAQMPPFMLARLKSIFCRELELTYANDAMCEVFKDKDVCLYGEGYGARIQKGGGNYIPTGCDFILFDIKIGEWYLDRVAMADIAGRLGIKLVPLIGFMVIQEAIDATRYGIRSQLKDGLMEGLVLKPFTELHYRNGERIMTKIKHKDFDNCVYQEVT
jgi:hypothetical protein